MRFNIKAQSNFLEIDLTDLVSTIINIETTNQKIKTEMFMRKFINDSHKKIISSRVKIRVKKYSNSMNFTPETGRIIEKWNGFYLIFSANEGAKRHTYKIFLMKKLDYKFKKSFLIFGKYEVVVDGTALQSDVMKSILEKGVQKYTTKYIMTNISLKILGVLLIFAGLFVFGVTHALAFFK